MKLNDAQLVLLSAASQREDRAVVLEGSINGGAQGPRSASYCGSGWWKRSRRALHCRRGGAMMMKERSRCGLPSGALPQSVWEQKPASILFRPRLPSRRQKNHAISRVPAALASRKLTTPSRVGRGQSKQAQNPRRRTRRKNGCNPVRLAHRRRVLLERITNPEKRFPARSRRA